MSQAFFKQEQDFQENQEKYKKQENSQKYVGYLTSIQFHWKFPSTLFESVKISNNINSQEFSEAESKNKNKIFDRYKIQDKKTGACFIADVISNNPNRKIKKISTAIGPINQEDFHEHFVINQDFRISFDKKTDKYTRYKAIDKNNDIFDILVTN